MTGPAVVVHPDAVSLAEAVAARLLTRILDAQAERAQASVVLTGGTVAAKVYAAIGRSPASAAVDWARVELWWGDERFLPTGHPDRNETQARAALLDALPLDPTRVHAMPATDGPDGDDAVAAATRYTNDLRAVAPNSARLPVFDVLLLGVGEDGHVASLFPNHPGLAATGSAAAVFDSPKPPPVRITLTLPTINSAREIWLIASGEGKAKAVDTALSALGRARSTGAPEHRPTPAPPGLASTTWLPAARVQGTQRTRWLLDRAAASLRS